MDLREAFEAAKKREADKEFERATRRQRIRDEVAELKKWETEFAAAQRKPCGACTKSLCICGEKLLWKEQTGL